MPLNVSYKNRIGYYYQHSQDGSNKWKIHFCHCNALIAMIHFCRENENGKQVDIAELCGFFADLTHAKRCINSGYWDERYSGFTFFAEQMDADHWKLVKMMTQKGIKVTIK